MRPIDADALECDTEWSEYHDGFISYSQMEIDTAPTIDAVSVVRCKECKHWNDAYICWRRRTQPMAMNPDDFCSYGEREGE